MRAFLSMLFRVTLNLFFRKIEIVGTDNVPPTGHVILVLNHPNALVDPALIHCYSPRQAVFLAKAPLFEIPIVGWIIRRFECLPVYRRSDDPTVDPSKNRETFRRAHELLGKQYAIAIFPEGASHCDPKLRALKTGTARIALGSAAGSNEPFWIVPVGLYYTSKATFRSEVLVCYSEPFEVDHIELNADFEPPKEAVRALTTNIAESLSKVTLQADTTEALEVVSRAEQLFTEERDSLHERFELKQRILTGYLQLKKEMPDVIAELEARVLRMEALCKELGLEPGALSPESVSALNLVRSILINSALFVFLVPLALIGVFVHFLPYHLVDVLAKRYSRDEGDMLSTIKILASVIFFPLTWLAIALATALIFSWQAAAIALVVAPLSGLAVIQFLDRSGHFGVAARSFTLLTRRREEVEELVREQEALRAAIIDLADRVG